VFLQGTIHPQTQKQKRKNRPGHIILMQGVRIHQDRVRMLREGGLPGGGEGKLGGDRIIGMDWVGGGLGGVLAGDLFVD
jgi:hypothetical protein